MRCRSASARPLSVIARYFAALAIVLFISNWATPSYGQGSNPPYGFVYTEISSSSTTSNLWGYTIDGSTGALSSVPSSPLSAGGLVSQIVAHPSGNFLYVSTATNQIAAFTVDSLTGALTPIPGSPYNDAYNNLLAITPNGKFLYALSSKIIGFAIDSATGALTPLPQLISAPSSSIVISPDGNYLYTNTAVFSIDPSTGLLTLVQSISGCGDVDLAIDRSRHYLYGVRVGHYGIAACQIDSATGKLSVVSGSPFASTVIFSGLAIDPSSPFLYATARQGSVVSNLAHVVYGFAIDESTGALVAMQNSPFAFPSMNAQYADTSTSGMAVDPLGKYVYVTEVYNGVASYSIDSTTGDLSLLSNSFTAPPAGLLTLVSSNSSTNPTLVSLNISPGIVTTQTSTLGKQVQFTLSGSYSDGSTRFLTDSATWSSTDTSVATEAHGLATEKGYGDTTIGASFGGMSATASLTVEAPLLDSIIVTPATATIQAGTAIAFHATGNYGDGSTLDLTSKVAWAALSPSIASIDDTGLALAKTTGNATITATYQEITGSATLTVASPVAPPNQFGHFVYAGEVIEGSVTSYVSGYAIDGPTGTLSVIPLSPFFAGGQVSQIVAHPSGNFLYVSTRTYRIAAFTVDHLTGGLTPVSGSPYAAGWSLAITPNGKFLYTTNPSSNVLGFVIDSTIGALSPIAQSPLPGGPLAMSPGGNYLYAGSDPVRVYSIDPSSGFLTPVQSTTACGGVASVMKIDSSGRYLYSLYGGISVCQIDPATGKLSAVPGSPFAPTVALSNLAVHPSAGFLYEVGAPRDIKVKPVYIVYGETIDESSGAPVAMQNSPFAFPGLIGWAVYPSDIVVEPHGRYAYASELNSGIGSYSVDPTTGELSLLSKSFLWPAAGPLAVLGSSQLWDPDLKWSAPSAITYGTALSATQLDATAGVPGDFVYTPPAGTILTAGSQSLAVNFTPTDSAEFNSQSATVALKINKAAPSIAWVTPAAITYGAALSSKQLDAIVTGVNGKVLAGTTVYSPAAGTILTAGTHTLSATFTPTDATDYTATNTSVSLTVNPATPAITWASPAAITYGTALSATQLDAAAKVPGTFVYSPATGFVLSGGTQTLTATFYPTDTANYYTAIAKRSITVNQAAPTLTWAKPANIAYGTALSATQLDAKANVNGTFVYSPAAGTVLPLGASTLTVTFTPTNSTDYTTAKATTGIWVSPATPAITWATPANITYGAALSATQLDATANVPGTFAYSPAAGTVLSPGTKTLTVTFTPTDTVDYLKTTGKVSLTVVKAAPALTWAKPASITYGTALSATQLDATASVPGTFVYSPAAGTLLSAGANTLSVTFTPTNTADYNSATATLGIWVYQAAPTITWATPAPITAGTALSSTQLDAAVTGVDGKTLAGTSVYSPAAGTVLAAGNHTLTVTFTPTSSNYKKATASVTLTVQ